MHLPDRLVVMYHSIAGKTPAVTGSYPLEMKRFEAQTKLLRKLGYHFSTMDELVETGDQRRVVITGDDGTVDWVENALPFCEAEGIPTLTGVITGVWDENPHWPLAHVVQVVLAHRSRKALETLAAQVRHRLSPQARTYVERVYAYEQDPVRRYVKGGCNLVLDEAQARQLIGPLGRDEKQALRKRFAQPVDYQRYSLAQVAAHSHRHAPLDADVSRYVSTEVEVSISMLQAKGFSPVPWFVAPVSPRQGCSVTDYAQAMGALGMRGILTSRSGFWDGKTFEVPRIDAVRLEQALGAA